MEQIIQNVFATIFGVKMRLPISIFNIGVLFWNKFLGMAFEYLNTSPLNFMEGEPYNFIETVNTIMVSVATPLSLLFFIWGFFNESVNVREEMNSFNIIKMLVRLLVANYFVVHSLQLLNSFIAIFTGLNHQISGKIAAGGLVFEQYSVYSDDIDYEITDLFDSKIFLLIFSVVVCVVLIVCGVMVIYNIFTKYLNILILMSFGCLAFSSMSAGNHEFHQMALSFIKHFLATAGELVVVFISINLVGVVANNMNKNGGLINSFATLIDANNSLNGMNQFIATGVIYCLMASLCIGMIKGASAIMQKVFS